MKAALVLVDLQHDYLQNPALEPAAGELVDRAAALLNACREIGLPVIHVRTSIDPQRDDRMPHWKRRGHRACVVGTEGHASPVALEPRGPSEIVVHKTFYSAFESDELDVFLAQRAIDLLGVAGLHTHGCVRATVLDAYRRGHEVRLIHDVVASDDPLHAARTEGYLAERAAPSITSGEWLQEIAPRASQAPTPETVLPAAVSVETLEDDSLERIVHHSPRDAGTPLWAVPRCGAELVSRVGQAACHAAGTWRATPTERRVELLRGLAPLLLGERELLARRLADEVGKPLREGLAEVDRSLDLLDAVTHGASDVSGAFTGAGEFHRRLPHGTIGVITPWNNPLSIPLGKIAPALLFGNAVVWKPAIPGSWIAAHLTGLLREAGFPPGLVGLVCGDRSTSEHVMRDPSVDAVSLSGSPAAGWVAQAICGGRRIPLQAELGGNNAAILWSDADSSDAASRIVRGAFGFAGQRCTANRRVIVEAGCRDRFVDELIEATDRLAWGDPRNEETEVGPLISVDKREQVARLVARMGEGARRVHSRDMADLRCDSSVKRDAYYPPTIVEGLDAGHEMVQHESFAPLLVVQEAASWEQALELLNGVRQGLVAALFSASPERRESFLAEARAGVLKIGLATDGAGVDLPFGGFKGSGLGPPEHGPGNLEFHTRLQAVYTRAATEV